MSDPTAVPLPPMPQPVAPTAAVADAATVCVAYCTCPELATAERLASALVEAGNAACVNLLPGLVSVYRWQGAVVREPEVLLLIKTTAGRLAALGEQIRQQHPYDVPELIAHPITAGLDDYLEWVRTCTRT